MNDKPLVVIHLDPALCERIETFQHKHRFAARTNALRWLLDWALGEEPKPLPEEVRALRRTSPGRPKVGRKEKN